MKTTKILNVVLLTLGITVFIASSAIGQRKTKLIKNQEIKPVYQVEMKSFNSGPGDTDSKPVKLDAGKNDVICSSDSYSLDGSAPQNVKIFWSTSGDGKFDNPTKLDAVYDPGKYDRLIGHVTLTLTEVPVPGLDKLPKSDSMDLLLDICPVPDVDYQEQ